MLHDYSGWHWLQPDSGRRLDPPASARLDSIRVLALVIVGEHDLPDFHAIAATLERGIPGARRVTMEGLGHLPNLEAPGAVRSAADGVLGGAGSRGGSALRSRDGLACGGEA